MVQKPIIVSAPHFLYFFNEFKGSHGWWGFVRVEDGLVDILFALFSGFGGGGDVGWFGGFGDLWVFVGEVGFGWEDGGGEFE